jgi:hypothetical protein
VTKEKTPRRFAEGTEVTVEKSRTELEALLDKHGATEFALHRSAERTVLLYRMHERMMRQVVDYPPADAYLYPDPKRTWNKRKPEEIKKLQEAEHRRRWRALVLITKARLELIAGGGSTFEREFMADTLLPNGQTVAEAMLPRIAESYASGEMPPLMLGSGGKP